MKKPSSLRHCSLPSFIIFHYFPSISMALKQNPLPPRSSFGGIPAHIPTLHQTKQVERILQSHRLIPALALSSTHISPPPHSSENKAQSYIPKKKSTNKGRGPAYLREKPRNARIIALASTAISSPSTVPAICTHRPPHFSTQTRRIVTHASPKVKDLFAPPPYFPKKSADDGKSGKKGGSRLLGLYYIFPKADPKVMQQHPES